jgi:hypothetical protein
MARSLPEFAPLSLKELRSFWKKYRGIEDIERLVLEVQFSRGVINEIDAYFKSIHQAWQEENLGELVAIEKVRLLLVQQHVRQSVLAWLKPASKRNEPPEPEPALID